MCTSFPLRLTRTKKRGIRAEYYVFIAIYISSKLSRRYSEQGEKTGNSVLSLVCQEQQVMDIMKVVSLDLKSQSNTFSKEYFD